MVHIYVHIYIHMYTNLCISIHTDSYIMSACLIALTTTPTYLEKIQGSFDQTCRALCAEIQGSFDEKKYWALLTKHVGLFCQKCRVLLAKKYSTFLTKRCELFWQKYRVLLTKETNPSHRVDMFHQLIAFLDQNIRRFLQKYRALLTKVQGSFSRNIGLF